jgi:hypothetical protein
VLSNQVEMVSRHPGERDARKAVPKLGHGQNDSLVSAEIANSLIQNRPVKELYNTNVLRREAFRRPGHSVTETGQHRFVRARDLSAILGHDEDEARQGRANREC